MSPAARDSNLACVGSAGRGRRLFEPPVPNRTGPGPHIGTVWIPHRDYVATTQGPVGPPHRPVGHTTGPDPPPWTGFGEHWGRGSKIYVVARFWTLTTVFFCRKMTKLAPKKIHTVGAHHQRSDFSPYFPVLYRTSRTLPEACRTLPEACRTL